MANGGENVLICPNCSCAMQLHASVKENPPHGAEPTTKGRFRLTSRESKFADLLLEGLPNKLIAEQLRTSVQVVKNNLQRVYDKVGCDNRAEFVKIVLTGNARGN